MFLFVPCISKMLVHKAQYDDGFAYRLFLKDDAIPRKKGHDRVLEPQAMSNTASNISASLLVRPLPCQRPGFEPRSERVVAAAALVQFQPRDLNLDHK